nr:hypothetical protein [Tanacetum cinerariifolium]
MKILDVLEQRNEKVRKQLNKAKQKMDVYKGREKILMETDTSYDHNPFQVAYAESSYHNPFYATSDESYDHNPFQATSDESSDHNLFQATTDDTLKSSFKDTCNSNSTWGKKILKKKQTRLRLYTKSMKKLCIHSVQTVSRVSRDGVRTFDVMASEIWLYLMRRSLEVLKKFSLDDSWKMI